MISGRLLPLRDERRTESEREERRQVSRRVSGVERGEIGDLRLAEHLQRARRESARRSRRARARARDVRVLDDALEAARSPRRCSSSAASRMRSSSGRTVSLSHAYSCHVPAPMTRARCARSRSAARSQVNVSREPARLRRPARRRARAIVGEAPHRRRHRAAMSPCGTRKPVSPSRTDSRMPGEFDATTGVRARGGLEVRDPPPLLRRREHERPRAAQQRELLRLGDAPKKPHAIAEVKRARERLERRPIVARAGDLERAPWDAASPRRRG